MAEIKNLKSLASKLKARIDKAKKESDEAAVIVGYTQAYAIYVHENLEAHHPVGQAKFLEQPARQLKGEIPRIVAELMKKGKTLLQALLVAGLRLQRESQQLVPIDTGALKNSAFTRAEK